MINDEIINNIKVQELCKKYGVDIKEGKIFNIIKDDFIILLSDLNKKIYILLDKNYNIICIDKCDVINNYKDLKKFVKLINL